MWAKATLAILTGVAAAGAVGCSAVDYRQPAGTTDPRRTQQPLLERFHAALGLVAELDYAKAIAELARLQRDFDSVGDEEHSAETLFWLGYCYEKRQRREEAVAFYTRVVSTYSHTPAARQAAERLGRMPEPERPKE